MMRIAILSDIHGNCLALDKALDDLQPHKVDRIVCLGDAIQGGPQPARVVARLRELGCAIIMGNADAWLLTGKETGSEVITAERQKILDAVREWTLSQLSSADRAFIQTFQPTVEIELDPDRKLLCFHGSPASFDDVILPDSSHDVLLDFMGNYGAQVMTGGHTHVQFMRRIDSSERFFFNPGSVGFAYSHHQPDESFRADPWAEYAVLTSQGGRLALEFRHVPFDPEEMISIYQASNRPYAEVAIGQYKVN
jgi:predicted phosphodiesterase